MILGILLAVFLVALEAVFFAGPFAMTYARSPDAAWTALWWALAITNIPALIGIWFIVRPITGTESRGRGLRP